MLSAALVGLTVAIIVTEIRRLFRGFKGIKPAELTQLINAGGTVVVDLSASGDFEKGHIAGSRNAQASAFGPDHKLVANAKQSPVVLVCRSGNASETAAKALKKAQEDPATFAEEVAVMIDTRRALEVAEAAAAVDAPEYVNSWRAPGKPG